MKNIQKTISLPLDSEGRLDRECPQSECLRQFKVDLQAWQRPTEDSQRYCVFCGVAAAENCFYTKAQAEYIGQIGAAELASLAEEELDKGYSSLRGKHGKGPITIEVSVTKSIGSREPRPRAPKPSSYQGFEAKCAVCAATSFAQEVPKFCAVCGDPSQ